MKNLLKKRRQAKKDSKAAKSKATQIVYGTDTKFWTAQEHKACMKAI